jgi:ketosteroid isomerase-like protein
VLITGGEGSEPVPGRRHRWDTHRIAAANVDRLRDFYAAVQAGDLDRAAEMFSAEVEIRTRLESHVGKDAARRMLDEAFSDFDARIEIEELTEPRPGTVVASYRLLMRGRYSNIDAAETVVDVARFRDGLIHSVDVFSNQDEAMAALSPSD